jgi:uncharacterized protein (TIGR00661 family)
MKVLYAIQGTGNGHVSRAIEVIPHLKKMAEVDIFLSGKNSNLQLPFEVKYCSKGLSFEYNNQGGLSYLKSIMALRPSRIMKEIRDFPAEEYDLIISDFECISAYAARRKGVPVMAFSHQVALLSEFAPKPAGLNIMGEIILDLYSPAKYAVGLHFKEYDDYIFTPIIRQDIRKLNPTKNDYYTVYLPACGDDQLLKLLTQIPDTRWEVFSRSCKTIRIERNITIRPIQNEAFINSLENCTGILTGAGFETPSEALFLNKKVFAIPIKGQYEQLCNAAALESLGVSVAYRFDDTLITKIRQWIIEDSTIPVHFPDITEQLIEQMLFSKQSFFLPTLAVG